MERTPDLALADLDAVLAAVNTDQIASTEALAALPLVTALRRRLDRCELALIESARAAGASWTTVAQGLGLASRQAAEQRFLRLSGESTRDAGAARATRRGQRTIDELHGEAIAELRAAIRMVLARIELDPGWDSRFRRAALCRASLAMAVDATPGGLFALAERALADLAEVPEGLPGAVDVATHGTADVTAQVTADVRRQLRRAIEAATP